MATTDGISATDNVIVDLDDTNNKPDLGTHVLLGVSVAACRPRAFSSNQPLYN